MADFQRVIFPGITQWSHPQFMGYFGATTNGPGILAEMLTARAERERDDVACFAGRDGTGNGRARLVAAMARFA